MVRHNSKNQLSIEEFKTPFQKSLNPENRWAKLSLQIPWDKLAEIYYGNMSKDQGAPCRDARKVDGFSRLNNISWDAYNESMVQK